MSSEAEAPLQPPKKADARRCQVCGERLSAYNPNPTCWRHTIGHPWRGPTARPKY